ncbi:uncharacterized protein CC84DRAFT_760781 [Paraphaeosphaeria sporulosa]|uniref:Uncharacterized protein n=1 Tax=Paraphaeosphaeria sporulosa TaxID=1460663 RepID=A0A177CHQ1_9PLEO|nr:uncharacterized protein CC84DRAFT_760781 [Paraphaeosphaeria sporulosa]OAG06320.1 hypothetical protein CC84DRAFT_760781 [Paraphaeosphaeria sporulosa]
MLSVRSTAKQSAGCKVGMCTPHRIARECDDGMLGDGLMGMAVHVRRRAVSLPGFAAATRRVGKGSGREDPTRSRCESTRWSAELAVSADSRVGLAVEKVWGNGRGG